MKPAPGVEHPKGQRPRKGENNAAVGEASIRNKNMDQLISFLSDPRLLEMLLCVGVIGLLRRIASMG